MRAMDALLPKLSVEFGVTLSEASQTVTLFSVAYGIALLVIGPLGDRFGKLRVILYGCLSSVLTASMCALAPDFSWLRLGRLASGVACSALMTLAMAWIGDVVPYDRRQRVLARLLAGMSLGVTTGILVGGLAADELIHWRAVFAGLSVVFAILAIALVLMRAHGPGSPACPEGARGWSLRKGLLEYPGVFGDPWARRIILVVFVEGAVFFGAVAFIPYHLHKTQGLTLSAASAIVMLIGLGGLFFAARAAHFVKAGERRLVAAGGALICVAFVAIAGSSVWQLAVPSCFVAGVGLYMVHSTLQTNATQIDPGKRGAVMAAFSASFFLGQATGVAAAGQVLAVAGSASVIFLSAIGVFAVGLTFAGMPRRVPR